MDRRFDADPAGQGAGDLGRRSEDPDPLGSPRLDEVLEAQPRPEWEAFSLKVSYLDLIRQLDAPIDHVHRAIADGKTYRLAGLEIPIEFSAHLYPAHRFLKREPERSRRVLRLIFANWLAHLEVPELQGSEPAVRPRSRSAGAPTA